MQHAISLFSSIAEDLLVDQNRQIIDKITGGPLIFLKQVFEEEKLPLTIFFKEKFKIEIVLTTEGEVGKVSETPSITPFPTIENDYTVISTILNEWDLSSISKYKGKIFLDIQGYVRKEGEFGSKKTWSDISKIP
ncbi:hypothetical protein M1615_02180 [Patescibacteria group bacterium]|nr:hypothetical protein [Patescibacteria group bacterium]